MARLIVKSPYIKAGGKRSAGGYVKYIATREGVEMAKDTTRHLPATTEQQQMIEQAIKRYPDAKDSHEYEDYRFSPTRGNADAFLRSVYKTYGNGTHQNV